MCSFSLLHETQVLEQRLFGGLDVPITELASAVELLDFILMQPCLL
jgi:hypothetical protein